MKVLQLTVHYAPNLGGVETHLLDLVKALTKRQVDAFVLSYQPLSTIGKWQLYERGSGTNILRLPWVRGLFYLLVPHPLLEFIYLTPGLFLVTPIILLIFRPNVIHAHGLVSAAVAVFWGKLFRTPVIISTHSLYNFPHHGIYRTIVKKIFNQSAFVLCLSKRSVKEVTQLGVTKAKIRQFTYWIDLDNFQKINSAKAQLNWQGKFIVLFVGRLVKEKGIRVLLKAATLWKKKINLVVAGSGPEEQLVKQFARRQSNITYIGNISQTQLPLYYSSADIVIVPSIHEEGFGRVIIESLACSTPVIAANRGSISEALGNQVGRLIDISAEEIKENVEELFNKPQLLRRYQQSCRPLAERRYSESNVDSIINTYQEAAR